MTSSLSLILLLVAVASASTVDISKEKGLRGFCANDSELLSLKSEDFRVESWLNSMVNNIQLFVQYGAHHTQINDEVLHTAFGETQKARYSPKLNASQNNNFTQERMYTKLHIANRVEKRPSSCKKNLKIPSWLSCVSVHDALK